MGFSAWRIKELMISAYMCFWVACILLVAVPDYAFFDLGNRPEEALEPLSLVTGFHIGVPVWAEVLYDFTSSPFVQAGAPVAHLILFIFLITRDTVIHRSETLLAILLHALVLCPYLIAFLFPVAATSLSFTYQSPLEGFVACSFFLLTMILMCSGYCEIDRDYQTVREGYAAQHATPPPSNMETPPALLPLTGDLGVDTTTEPLTVRRRVFL